MPGMVVHCRLHYAGPRPQLVACKEQFQVTATIPSDPNHLCIGQPGNGSVISSGACRNDVDLV